MTKSHSQSRGASAAKAYLRIGLVVLLSGATAYVACLAVMAAALGQPSASLEVRAERARAYLSQHSA